MCTQETYEEGITISRNYENRTTADTERLYAIIISAVTYAQDSEDARNVDALKFLVTLYEPHMRKVASKLYNSLRGVMDYYDIVQEIYTMFLTLLYKYDPKRAAFTYYIGVMLPQHMQRWAEKELLHASTNITVNMQDYTIPDIAYNDINSVDDRMTSYIITRDYMQFIQARSERQARSGTVKEVCDKHFLGKSTCSEIARDLNISYHAVYEIIGKIKNELRLFFHNNKFSTYVMSSTGYAQI